LRASTDIANRARALAGEARTWAADARWSVPLLAYRASGRRMGRSPELYRAWVPRQRRRAQRLPGMTTPTERAYFKWHAQEEFSGGGAIVDLGSWFGSTTVMLAMGVAANHRRTARDKVIHAFDRFAWEPWMDAYAGATRLGAYLPGDSFLPEFKLAVRGGTGSLSTPVTCVLTHGQVSPSRCCSWMR
jgi:hypothetical protein